MQIFTVENTERSNEKNKCDKLNVINFTVFIFEGTSVPNTADAPLTGVGTTTCSFSSFCYSILTVMRHQAPLGGARSGNHPEKSHGFLVFLE